MLLLAPGGDNVAYITESALGSLVAIEWPHLVLS